MTSSFSHTFDIAVDHPSFKGHFPKFPVFPAVSQLSLLTEALSLCCGANCSITAIPVAKFLSPVTPDASLSIELRRREQTGFDFLIRCSQTVVAKGQLKYRIVEP